MNPATALAAVLTDELLRCGVREAVVAPGSRSAPLAMALYEAAVAGPGGPRLRLHVRVDERSAAFLALGLARGSGAPVAVVCTSGTAAAHFHAAVIEADESCVPLLVLTADRPPELRGTGANQTVDQVKLYGGAVRWFCEAGVPEDPARQARYWRSLACRAVAQATGSAGGPPGPVHLNLAFREPLVPGAVPGAVPGGGAAAGTLPASLAGRPGGVPWTAPVAPGAVPGAVPGAAAGAGTLELPWVPRGVVVCGDGIRDPGPLAALAERAGWPLLAEPSSGARRGPAAVPGYQYLLGSAAFLAGHRPEVIVSAGRAGLSRGQLAFLGQDGVRRHVVIAQAAGRWADPARSATDVAGAVTLAGAPPPGTASPWLASWLRAGQACQDAADKVLDAGERLTEPRLARDLAALLPGGALLWVASSLPARDLDRHALPRDGLAILASRGASGIDGLVSSAIGAALAHQAAGGGPAAALLGDLALVHDSAGLMTGPGEPLPGLCLIVVNNDGGGIFSDLEQAAFPGPFERVFGTPHGTSIRHLAAAAGLPYARIETAADLPGVLAGTGLRVAELRTSRAEGAALRARLREAAAAALAE